MDYRTQTKHPTTCGIRGRGLPREKTSTGVGHGQPLNCQAAPFVKTATTLSLPNKQPHHKLPNQHQNRNRNRKMNKQTNKRAETKGRGRGGGTDQSRGGSFVGLSRISTLMAVPSGLWRTKETTEGFTPSLTEGRYLGHQTKHKTGATRKREKSQQKHTSQ